MEYLNIGSVFVGVLLILGFFNADAIFREPAISDGFDDSGDEQLSGGSRGSLLEPSRMYTREMLSDVASRFGLPVVELERRLDSGATLHEIAAASGRSREMEAVLNEYAAPAESMD